MNPWLNRFYWLSSIALFIGFPTSKALISIGIGLLGICAIIEVFQIEKGRPTYMPILWFGLLFLLHLSSTVYSDPVSNGLDETLRQHAFMSIPLCFWLLSDWLAPRIKLLIHLFIGACVFHGLLTMGLYLLPEATVASFVESVGIFRDYPDVVDRLKFGLYTPLIDRLNFAYLIGFGLLYLIYETIVLGILWKNMIAGGILLLVFMLIGARGAQIAFLIALGIGGISLLIARLKAMKLSKEVYQQRLTAFIVMILIGLTLSPYIAYKTIPAVQKRYDQMQWELRLINNGDYVKEEYQYFSTLTRIRSWSNATDIIQDHPFLGVGIGDYKDALIDSNVVYNDKVPAHNQNFFLYIWGASGIAALLGLLYALWRYTRSFWKSPSHHIRHLTLAYVSFIVISCMLDAFLKYHIGSISVMTMLSALYLIHLFPHSAKN